MPEAYHVINGARHDCIRRGDVNASYIADVAGLSPLAVQKVFAFLGHRLAEEGNFAFPAN